MFLGITFQINLLHLNLCLRVCFWGNSNWVTIDIGVAFMLHLVHGFHWERLNISRRETFHWPLNPHCALQFSSATQSCPTLCDPMNCSTPGLPVHHQLPLFTQTHVHRVSDAIQPSHPLSSPSPPAPNPSQHQSLFQ